MDLKTRVEGKRPIDLKRNSAASMDVGTPDDDSAIEEFYIVNDTMYVVKKKGIYLVKLADQIDPERTNISIPNTHQRILKQGSDNEIVARLILTAKELFSNGHIKESVKQETAKQEMLDLVKNLLVMEEIFERISIEETKLADELALKKFTNSFLLPSLSNLDGEIKSFIQKADHARENVLNIIRAFYGSGIRHVKAFREKVKKQNPLDNNFLAVLDDVESTFVFLRNVRHCLEHPRHGQNLQIKDFTLTSGGEVSRPSIAIIHDQTPQEEISLINYMEQIIKRLIEIGEYMLVALCDRNGKDFGHFTSRLTVIPEEQRRNPHVKYGYRFFVNNPASDNSSEATNMR